MREVQKVGKVRQGRGRHRRNFATRRENNPKGPIRKYPQRSWFQITFQELFEPPYNLSLKPAMLMGLFHNMADKNASSTRRTRSCAPTLDWLAKEMHESVDTVEPPYQIA